MRADSAPIPKAPDVSFQFEYTSERNGDALDSNAWTLLGAYEFSAIAMEAEDLLPVRVLPGRQPETRRPTKRSIRCCSDSTDWGSWWQGEIAGEYFLSNSNLISHQFRAHVTPNDKIGGGLIFYDFRHRSAEGASARPSRTTTPHSKAIVYVDWKLTRNLMMSVVTAFADPGAAVQQLTGRTKNFTYGMVYVAYSY